MNPAPPSPLPGQNEFVSRLALRFPVDRPVLERVARRVLEEEAARRAEGRTPTPIDGLLERASRLLSAAVPPPVGDDPFQAAEDDASLGELGLEETSEPDAPFVVERPAPPPAPRRPAQPTLFEPSALDEEPPEYDPSGIDEGSPRSRRGMLPVILVVVGVLIAAAAAYYFLVMRAVEGEPVGMAAFEPTPVEEMAPPDLEPNAADTPVPVVEPEPEAQAEPTAAPAVEPSAASAWPTAATASAPATGPAGRTQGRAAAFATEDWSGEPYFGIHFSSYRDRAAAGRDAEALARRHSLPARVLGAELPDGTWYRVMLGEFGSDSEALDYRRRLAERGTPDLGWVYRVTPRR